MFLRRAQALVGVDAGSRQIKVVASRFRRGRGYDILGAGSAPTPEGVMDRGQIIDPVRLGEAVRAALRDAGVRVRRAALAVPSTVGFVRRMTFPPMPLEELRAAIDLQPDRYIPFAHEGAVYDLHPLPREGEASEQAVVVGAAPRAAVLALMQGARAAGLRPVRIDLEPLALFRAALATGQATLEGVIAIVDLGGSSAKIALFQRGVPVVSRVVDMPAEAGQPAGEGAAELFLDIRRSLEFALTHANLALTRVLVTGGAGDDAYQAIALTGYLRSFLGNRITRDFQVELLSDPRQRVPASHMVALGLSLPPEMFT